MDPLSLLLFGIAFAAFGALSWSAVSRWFESRRSRSRYGEMIRERLASGRVRIVAGVFDGDGRQVGSETWEAGRLGVDLADRFGQSDRVRIDL